MAETKEVKALKKTLLTNLRKSLKALGPKVTEKEWEREKADMSDFTSFVSLAETKAQQELLVDTIEFVKAL